MALQAPSVLKNSKTPPSARKTASRVNFKLLPSEDMDIRQTLQERLNTWKDDDSHYRLLINHLSSEETSDENLEFLVKKIRENILLLEQPNEELISTLLNRTKWLSRSDRILQLFSSFFLDLACAHGCHLSKITKSLLNVFLNCDEDGLPHEKVAHVHNILKGMCNLIPTFPPKLVSSILQQFPYFKKMGSQQGSYIRHCLIVLSYITSQHKLELLNVVMNKVISLDIRCPRELIISYKENNKDTDGVIFEMEEDDKNDNQKTEGSGQLPLADTLDNIMEEIFLYIDKSCEIRDRTCHDWPSTKRVYLDFLNVFDKVILPTHNCHHVQFIMFYFCSLRPALCEGFVDYLWKKVENPNTSLVIRQTAAFYLGSFLARAKFMPIKTIQLVLEVMCNWLHMYIGSCDNTRLFCDISVHGTFYAVCQAVFYIFAFRHKELMHGNKGLSFLRSLNFESVVTCGLNPLKMLFPTVVQNFANISRHYQLVYCHTIIERNSRSCLPVVGLSAEHHYLETFFPFDPYLLNRSVYRIKPLYSEFENFDLNKEQMEEMAIDEPSPTPTKGIDFFSYSTSPGFLKHKELLLMQLET